MSVKPVAVGIIGCGAVAQLYLQNARLFSRYFKVVACADLDCTSAQKLAAQFNACACSSTRELLDSPEVELVLNLTVPLVHAEVTLSAIATGKHVYSEKPLATTVADAKQVLGEAAANNVQIGCAPDTFLGGAHQAARELIDSGAIGKIIGGCAFMLSPGTESWHPNPAFFYKAGGGPLFDMGPYYITNLVNLLGPVQRVTSSAQTHIPVRTVTSKPHIGQQITVEVPTHVAAVLDFASGPTITLTTSFEVQASTVPNMELYGTGGSVQVPDPNFFGGNVLVRKPGSRWWKKVRHRHPYCKQNRGLGLADMALAIRSGQPVRCDGALALHVVEVMEAIHRSSEEGIHIPIASAPHRPDPLDMP